MNFSKSWNFNDYLETNSDDIDEIFKSLDSRLIIPRPALIKHFKKLSNSNDTEVISEDFG